MKKIYFDTLLSGLIPIRALRRPKYGDRNLEGPVSWESDPESYLVVEVLKSGPEYRDGKQIPESLMAYKKGERLVVHRVRVVFKVKKAKTMFQYVSTATEEDLNLKEEK